MSSKGFVKSLVALLLLCISGLVFAVPSNAHELGNGWECDIGFIKQSQQCNPLYIPPNARLEGKKWVCLPGYKRRSNQCNPLNNTKRVAITAESKAEVNQAESLFLLGNHDKAFKALLPLAKEGKASAQFYLAELYQTDKRRLDKKQAMYWYQKAAGQGNPNAQFNLANAYYVGDGVAVDLLQAANWYERAAKSGVPEAQLNLGYMYSKGKGVQQDDKRAILWYEVAAQRGNIKAQSNLGYRYCNGIGVEKNLGQCAFWVKQAMDQGNSNAKKMWGTFDLQKHFDGAEKIMS